MFYLIANKSAKYTQSYFIYDSISTVGGNTWMPTPDKAIKSFLEGGTTTSHNVGNHIKDDTLNNSTDYHFVARFSSIDDFINNHPELFI
jgi:poly-D-alanine transfer protein DltD